MKSDCRFYAEHMGPLLLGELSSQEEEEFEQHFQVCLQCAAEKGRLSETLEQLGSLEEVSVPRPFFVSPPPEAISPWQLSKRLPWRWQVALSSTALALVLVGAFSLGGLEVRVEAGALTLGFGGLAPRPSDEGPSEEGTEIEELTLAVLEAVEQRLRVRDRAMAEAVRGELSNLRSELERNQSSVINTALDRHQERLEQRWFERSGALETGVREFVVLSYDHFSDQYRTDLESFSSELDLFAIHNVLQERRMDLLSNAVLDIAAVPDRSR